MQDKLAAIEAKYSQIEARLGASETYEDPALVAKLNKEQAELQPLVETYRSFLQAQQRHQEAESLLSDPEMKELAQEEWQQSKEDLERLEQELKILLLPKDPNDDKNVIVEIRAAWAARRPPCLPTPCIACTPCSPRPTTGKPRWTVSTKQN